MNIMFIVRNTILASGLALSLSPFAAAPVVVSVRVPSLNAIDTGVSAGYRYLIASDDYNFRVFDKFGFLSEVKDTELSNATAPTGEDLRGGENLFRNLLYDDTTRNVNKNHFTNETSAVKCDWTHPFSSPVAAPDGIVMNKNSEGELIPWPSSSCLNEVYDVRTTYDTVRQRFWIAGQARNQIWDSSCNVAKSTNKTLCKRLNAQARRYTMVAVSKDSDPHHGFWKYIVAKDYADWPMMAVHDDYAMFFHNDWGPFRIYDADAMAAGPSLPPEIKIDGDVLDAGFEFEGTHTRVPKHHEGGASTLTYILSAANNPMTNDLWIYALLQPEHAGDPPTLIGPAHYADPKGRVMYMHDAAFAHGRIYLTNSATGGADLWEVPITRADVENKIEIDPKRVTFWELNTPGQTADLATVEITDQRDVVVGWRSFNTDTSPTLARYAVLYHGKKSFEPIRSVFNLAGTKGTIGQLDFVSAVRDGHDPSYIWTALCDEKGFVLSSIAP